MIKKFRGVYSFLSNFFPCRMEYEGVKYTTAEHAFQGAKFDDMETKLIISKLKLPAEAKKFGRMAGPPRKDWGSLRVDVMREILKIKFSQPGFKAQLLKTGDQELEEGNEWGDKFWGVCDGEGSNYLGKLLMEIRKELGDAENSDKQ